MLICGVGRRRAALHPRSSRNRGLQASSWQGLVVDPGGAPAPPECSCCVHESAGTAPHPASRRLMIAPLSGRGDGIVSEAGAAGIALECRSQRCGTSRRGPALSPSASSWPFPVRTARDELSPQYFAGSFAPTFLRGCRTATSAFTRRCQKRSCYCHYPFGRTCRLCSPGLYGLSSTSASPNLR